VSKSEKDIRIQYRIGLALKTIIISNKSLLKKDNQQKEKRLIPDDSYGKLSSSTGIRAASISDIINGKSNPKGITLISLLEALGVSMCEFGKIYDEIDEKQINQYIAEVTK